LGPCVSTSKEYSENMENEKIYDASTSSCYGVESIQARVASLYTQLGLGFPKPEQEKRFAEFAHNTRTQTHTDWYELAKLYGCV